MTMEWPRDIVGQEIAPDALITYAVRKGSAMELRPARVLSVTATIDSDGRVASWRLRVLALYRRWERRDGRVEAVFRARKATLFSTACVTVTGLSMEDFGPLSGKDTARGPEATEAD
jgi:hypothetical protein